MMKIVHHYIYDEEMGGETEVSIVPDEEIEGIVGQSYETSPSENVDANYECINTEPEGKTGTMTKTEIEVTYYYRLKQAEVGGEIGKTAEASTTKEVEYETGDYDEFGQPIVETKVVPVLTDEDGEVKYTISYRAGAQL